MPCSPSASTEVAADVDISHSVCSHPALQSVKTILERHERQTKRTLSQHRTELKAIGHAQPSSVRTALTAFVTYCDARKDGATGEKDLFVNAADALRQKSHWLETSEALIHLARAALFAQQQLVVVAPPQSSLLFDARALESLAVAVRRGIKLEYSLSALFGTVTT